MAKAKRKSFLNLGKKELIIIAIALLIVVGVSFAWLTQTITNSRENVIVAGKLELQLSGGDPIIKIGGTYGYGYPMTDYDGIQTTPYGFMVTNTGTEHASYKIYLDDVNSYTDKDGYTVNVTNNNRISDSFLKYTLTTGTPTVGNAASLASTGTPRVIVIDTLAPGQSKTYNLRLWITGTATNSDVVGKAFAGKLRIEATQDIDDAIYDWSYYNN